MPRKLRVLLVYKMVLIGFSWVDALLGTLYVSLGVLALIILYRLVLRRLAKGSVSTVKNCRLYNIEENPCAGELVFYFEAPEKMDFKFIIQDEDFNEVQLVQEGLAEPGGNLLRFDSTVLRNGSYFYVLETSYERNRKRMDVNNA